MKPSTLVDNDADDDVDETAATARVMTSSAERREGSSDDAAATAGKRLQLKRLTPALCVILAYSELHGTRKPRFGARLDFLSRLAAAARSPSQRQRPNDLQELLGFSDRLGAAAMGDGMDWP